VVGAIFSALRGEKFVHKPTSLLQHEGELANSSGAVAGEIALDPEVVR
jgi:hypothetical protein